MKTKPSNKWIVEKGKVQICIEIDCNEKAFSDCLCMKHYDENNKELKLTY